MPLNPPSSRGPLASVIRALTAAEIATLQSAPVTLLAAQGAGTVIVPVAASAQFKPGTVRFFQGSPLSLQIDGNQVMVSDSLGFSGTGNDIAIFNTDAGAEDLANGDLTLRAAVQPGYRGPILTSSLNAAGSLWRPGDTATVDDGTGGLVTVSTVGNSFPITAVNQPGKTFTVTGDASAFALNDVLTVYRSTANDGDYTVVSAVFGAGSTVITVVEAIPSATANGAAGDSTSGSVGTIATYALTTPGTGYTVASHDLTAVAPSAGTGASINVLTITNASDGTGRIEVLYYVMPLLA